jgi:transposase
MIRTTLEEDTTAAARTLYLALELSQKTWKLAFSVGDRKVRTMAVPGGAVAAVLKKVEETKARRGLAPHTRVLSCYEAGRDGFWIHRALVAGGIQNVVVDASSIEVDRRKRRAKTDRLDATKLVLQLVRHDERGDGLRTVRIPTEEQEDERRPHRELERLVKERTGHLTRIRALLATRGVRVKKVSRSFGLMVDVLRTPSGEPLPAKLREELKREAERLELVYQQVRRLEKERTAALESGGSTAMKMAGMLLALKSIGPNAATILVREFFGWREFKNGKQVGACAGLTGTPFDSGNSAHEQGISKAGNRRIRAIIIEVAWLWLRYQPQSRLARWYLGKFGESGKRSRRVGIVALARKLLVALWRYVDQGVIPDGALMKA